MITRLEISGLALIDSLSVEFSPGFNVITGETGAGKSILIRALNLLSGTKAGSELVREGRPAAIVSGIFDVNSQHRVHGEMEKFGIPTLDEIVLRRQVLASGKSQAWINDVSVTLVTLREISKCLIDIFSQHENQRLLDAGTHVEYLDRLGKHSELKGEIGMIYDKVADLVKEIRSLVIASGENASNLDYLQFRLAELDKFNPSQAEFDELTASVSRRERLQRDRETLSFCVDQIENRAVPALRELEKGLLVLGKSDDPNKMSRDVCEKMTAVIESLETFSFGISREFEGDIAENLEADQARLYKYQELIRKCRDIAGVVTERNRIQTAVDAVEHLGQVVGKLLIDLDKNVGEWEGASGKLSAQRKKSAKNISTAVAGELNLLAMAGAHFEVRFFPAAGTMDALLGDSINGVEKSIDTSWAKIQPRLKRVAKDGAESAEFLLGANPGEKAFSLGKIASGGELSRIMLALKKVLLSGADTCVMVFDEIDSGISGRVADIVGQKIAELARDHQVLCISHLPQVSVYASAHLQVKKQVKKSTRGDRSESSIVRLSPAESQQEIARMLSGEKVSKSSLENAQALMARAKALHSGCSRAPT